MIEGASENIETRCPACTWIFLAIDGIAKASVLRVTHAHDTLLSKGRSDRVVARRTMTAFEKSLNSDFLLSG